MPRTVASAWSSWATQPEITWPSVTGVASCRCVRPTMTTPSYSAALPARVSRSASIAGTSTSSSSTAAAMCIAAGKVSLLDCPMFTSSLGWTGLPAPRPVPASSSARLAITSLAFMLLCVPLPVWKTTSGNSASSAPSMTSVAARSMSSALSCGSRPSSSLARAAASLSTPSAQMTRRPQRNVATPMGKCSSERWVCAPQ